MHTESQLGWFNLPHLPILTHTVTAKQRVVIIPGNQPEGMINGYGGKDFEKRKVLGHERSTSGPGSGHGDGDELGDDEGSN